MEPTIPWYQSAIVRQQIAQLIVAGTALFGVNLGGLDVDATLVSIFAGVAALIAVYTAATRIFKPNPNITATAVRKEIAMVKAGTIPASPTGPGSQRGFFRTALLVCVAFASAGLALVALPGCAGTKAAYGAAESLPDTAYVVAEHYAAVVKEAADIAQSPATEPAVRDALKAADSAVKPFILGDENRPGLRELAARYIAVKTAQNQAELQAAVNAAVLELARLINAVKAARRPT